jgi:hypothetical protein
MKMVKNEKVNIGVLFNHINYIKESLEKIDKKIDEHGNIINNVDGRLKIVEQRKKDEEEQLGRKMQKYGFIIAIVAITVSTVVNVLIWLF